MQLELKSEILGVSVYLALGVNLEGKKELLGMWIEENEGAKLWLNVMTELKNRGLNDIFIASIDGLKGFPDAINTVFPETEIQLCIVHQVRNSLKFVSWKDRKEVANDLKEIYRAPTEETGLEALNSFENKWNEQYPVISKSWRPNWENLQTFFKFPAEIRKVIYTTNAIESVNMSLRKVTKTRASFPNDDALYKMFYLALKNISKRWTMPIQNWNLAINRFIIIRNDCFRTFSISRIFRFR
jgi:putative transposase